MVPLVMLASTLLGAVYPTDSVSSESPLGRYSVVNEDFDKETANGNHHALFLVDQATATRTPLMEYGRHVDVAWAPDQSAVAVNDHSGSTDSDVVVYYIDAGKIARRVSLLSLLTTALPSVGRELRQHGHRYLDYVQWREGGRLDCRLQAHDGGRRIDRHYVISLTGQVREIASEPKTSTKSVDTQWRDPSRAELSESWRDRDKDRFAVVRGDFDGDGTMDEARLVVSKDARRIAIRVTLSSSRKVQVVGATPQSGSWHPILSMGIHAVKPGRYPTACGKGYFECATGEGEELVLEHDAVDFFQEESADSVFYLPARQATFRRVWMSD